MRTNYKTKFEFEKFFQIVAGFNGSASLARVNDQPPECNFYCIDDACDTDEIRRIFHRTKAVQVLSSNSVVIMVVSVVLFYFHGIISVVLFYFHGMGVDSRRDLLQP